MIGCPSGKRASWIARYRRHEKKGLPRLRCRDATTRMGTLSLCFGYPSDGYGIVSNTEHGSKEARTEPICLRQKKIHLKTLPTTNVHQLRGPKVARNRWKHAVTFHRTKFFFSRTPKTKHHSNRRPTNIPSAAHMAPPKRASLPLRLSMLVQYKPVTFEWQKHAPSPDALPAVSVPFVGL